MRQKNQTGYLYIMPWIIGFFVFTVIPLGFAFYIGLTEWDTFNTPKFVGLGNYVSLFKDEDFLKALWVTIRFGLISVPLGIATSLLIACVVNTKIKGVNFFRTALYLPAVVSGVSISLLWKWILDQDFGLINMILSKFGIGPFGWLTNPDLVLPSYLMIVVWGAGGGMLTYLAGLQDIPSHLYEAADIDGANLFHKFKNITLPILTPVIFYNLVMGIVGAMRKFSDAYIIGGADNEGRFFMVYLYENAFKYFKMGYATAMGWVLFVIILALTLIVFRSSSAWVYYESEVKKKSKKGK
ncbi:sugar ABC transporter permease [Paenibacillus sp. D2_2]|uniref:carbohydrate ABC transporter permease n=1 Tax=Paenibacillus sp. D2_2 TaxID=3073092 RepID=UPI0028163E42|nr:sugar ABC transporter permease [Paenibacillus sp. D2_2]WMT41810.1 sugar ABC transporter permease [Paenibacillus sp. D2_2]